MTITATLVEKKKLLEKYCENKSTFTKNLSANEFMETHMEGPNGLFSKKNKTGEFKQWYSATDNNVEKIDFLYFKIVKDIQEKLYYIFTNEEVVYDKFRKEGVNNSLAKKENDTVKYYENYNSYLKIFYYLLITTIVIITVVKGQYKNKKILIYVLALFLLPYGIQPIFEKIHYSFYNTSRIIQLSISYIFLAIMFLLLNSFSMYVFDDANFEGNRDMKILYGILFMSGVFIFSRYLFYNYGLKEFN